MKAMTAIAVLLAFGATAQAKVAPLERAVIATGAGDSAINIDPTGAQREADYFHAPQSPLAGERLLLPCRLQHVVFDKTRLAQSCR